MTVRGKERKEGMALTAFRERVLCPLFSHLWGHGRILSWCGNSAIEKLWLPNDLFELWLVETHIFNSLFLRKNLQA